MSDPGTFVTALAAARRAVQLYPPTHPSFVEAIDAVVASATDMISASGSFVLNLHQGHLYAGSSVIGADTPAAGALGDSMERHKVESLTFEPGFRSVDAAALAEVLNMRPSADFSVAEELERRGVTTILVADLESEDDEEREERERRRDQDRAMYRQLVGAMRSTHQEVEARAASPNLGQARNIVGNIMSRLLEDDSAVLGLAMMSSEGETALYHSINVMIYSLTLGLQLGLPDEGLLSLGMSALVHDVGKAAFDLSDPEQAQQVQPLHPVLGAEILSRMEDADRTPMLVAFEHHMEPDGGGFPPREPDYIGHPYSRMVQIADRYENLTKRGEDGEPLTPDRAVMQLLHESGRRVDAMFCRIFVRALGVFPIGCVVRLSDQTVGVISAKTHDPLRPKLISVYDPQGEEIEGRPEIDLTGDERTIVEVLEPDALRMDVADHI